ncbi:hypothetical protein QFC21_007349 [Naganishia friedmannii]|uniref:Uncharacterized protein n=1 Tax=Naganishia friedmannii TaxID=89922 RepID=A0ACC2UVY1_9TREE|nr:hypothetical protein QFC21_007349 [Naganishia friedmannii]
MFFPATGQLPEDGTLLGPAILEQGDKWGTLCRGSQKETTDQQSEARDIPDVAEVEGAEHLPRPVTEFSDLLDIDLNEYVSESEIRYHPYSTILQHAWLPYLFISEREELELTSYAVFAERVEPPVFREERGDVSHYLRERALVPTYRA